LQQSYNDHVSQLESSTDKQDTKSQILEAEILPTAASIEVTQEETKKPPSAGERFIFSIQQQ
jgi:hypothetical protein